MKSVCVADGHWALGQELELALHQVEREVHLVQELPDLVVALAVGVLGLKTLVDFYGEGLSELLVAIETFNSVSIIFIFGIGAEPMS